MIDIVDQINQVRREVGDGRIAAGAAHVVRARRSYDTPIEDLWDACTNPDRIKRWFLPVSGDLRPGGSYQLEGNAGGEILRCEPPELLKLTWEFGGLPPSEVEVRLSTGPDRHTVFELEHIAVVDPAMWTEFGPGAVGVGWDLTLLGLGLHVGGGEVPADPQAWQRSAEARDFMTRSGTAWGAAHTASGASADEAAAAAKRTMAAYMPDLDG